MTTVLVLSACSDPVTPAYDLTDCGEAGRIYATADAVQILGDAVIQDCTITGSGGHGVSVEAGLLSLRRCNIVSNRGDAGWTAARTHERNGPATQ